MRLFYVTSQKHLSGLLDRMILQIFGWADETVSKVYFFGRELRFMLQKC